MSKLSQTSEIAAKSLKPFQRESGGRPFLEFDHPGIIDTILDIVQATTATDDHRRSQILRTTRTLDDLHLELSNIGYNCNTGEKSYVH